MFGNKRKRLHADLEKCKIELKKQRTYYIDLLHENTRLTEKLRQSNSEILTYKKQLKFPPAFQEGQIIGSIEILEIKEIVQNEMPAWLSSIWDLAGVALFVATAALVVDAAVEINEKPKYKYRIYNQAEHTERYVTETELNMIVGEKP